MDSKESSMLARCCKELMARDPTRVDDRFIRQTLDPHLIVRIV